MGDSVSALTDAGTAEAAAVGPELPWDDASTGTEQRALQTELRQLLLAVRQIGVAGDENGLQRATALVPRGRRQAIYRILADG